MITFTCDLCGLPAIPRTKKGIAVSFEMNNSPTLPELVHRGIHVVFYAVKEGEKPDDRFTYYKKRDAEVADLCRECLLRALQEGHEVTEDYMKVTP